MRISFKLLRIAIWSAMGSACIVAAKYSLHLLGWEPIEQSSLHNSVVSSATFVLGFLLSVTMSDYKESERLPAEIATNLEDLYDDAASIHSTYPVFSLTKYRNQLRKIAKGFRQDIRKQTYDASKDIRALAPYFAQMEAGKVPPNFVVKLKQQQTSLLRSRHRLNYIQRIRFIPSATILVRCIVVLVTTLLLLTNVDPFYGSLAIVSIISFMFIYVLILIEVISTPFHASGKTYDDVSMFLITMPSAIFQSSSVTQI